MSTERAVNRIVDLWSLLKAKRVWVACFLLLTFRLAGNLHSICIQLPGNDVKLSKLFFLSLSLFVYLYAFICFGLCEFDFKLIAFKSVI